MLVSTTDIIQDRKIIEYKGVVNGQAIVGAHIFKDIFAAFRDFFGGRSRSYESTIESARHDAMLDLLAQAKAMGANAVIGLDFEYQAIGQKGSMLMVAISGTAVTV